MFGVVNQTVS